MKNLKTFILLAVLLTGVVGFSPLNYPTEFTEDVIWTNCGVPEYSYKWASSYVCSYDGDIQIGWIATQNPYYVYICLGNNKTAETWEWEWGECPVADPEDYDTFDEDYVNFYFPGSESDWENGYTVMINIVSFTWDANPVYIGGFYGVELIESEE